MKTSEKRNSSFRRLTKSRQTIKAHGRLQSNKDCGQEP